MQVRHRRSSILMCFPLILALICLCGGLLAGISLLSGQESAQAQGNTRHLVYGLTLNVSGFDPHFNQSAELGIPYFSVYDTLVYRHPQTMGFEAGLAEAWEISEDGHTYTFHLKQGVLFHDDTIFNAAAVGVNLDRIANPDFGSQRAKALLGPYYQGYAIVDNYTIQIILSQPYEPLLDGLSQMYLGIASPTALANYADGTYQFNQVGTGPYRVQKVIPGESIILERNPDYTWGPVFYTQNNPNPVEEIEFRFYTDAATRDDALQSGEVDVVGELLPIDAELLVGNSDVRIYPVPIPGQPLQYIFNQQLAPTDQLPVRQALIRATNRIAIVDAIFAGQSEVAYSPISRSTLFYNPALEEDMYPYSAQEARSMLESMGYADSDNDGILEINGTPLTIKILIVSTFALLPETTQAIADQWEQIGIDVEIQQVPNYPELLAKIEEGDWNLVAEYSFGLEPSLLNNYYMTGGFKNFGGYSNSEVDQWLTQALAESNAENRAILYSNVQRRIMEDAVILPVRDYLNLNGATSELDGIIFSANGWWPLLNNFQWAD